MHELLTCALEISREQLRSRRRARARGEPAASDPSPDDTPRHAWRCGASLKPGALEPKLVSQRKSTGIAKVTAAVNELGARKECGQKTQVESIVGILSNNAVSQGVQIRQPIEVLSGEAAQASPGRGEQGIRAAGHGRGSPRAGARNVFRARWSSPTTKTRGWLARICSTSVVPDLGMPTTKTGRSESRPNPPTRSKNSGVNAPSRALERTGSIPAGWMAGVHACRNRPVAARWLRRRPGLPRAYWARPQDTWASPEQERPACGSVQAAVSVEALDQRPDRARDENRGAGLPAGPAHRGCRGSSLSACRSDSSDPSGIPGRRVKAPARPAYEAALPGWGRIAYEPEAGLGLLHAVQHLEHIAENLALTATKLGRRRTASRQSTRASSSSPRSRRIGPGFLWASAAVGVEFYRGAGSCPGPRMCHPSLARRDRGCCELRRSRVQLGAASRGSSRSPPRSRPGPGTSIPGFQGAWGSSGRSRSDSR